MTRSTNKAKPRTIVVYTSKYSDEPFRIVFDSSVDDGDPYEMAARWDEKKAVDPETRVFRVGNSCTNDEVLHFMNSTMEMALPKWTDEKPPKDRSRPKKG